MFAVLAAIGPGAAGAADPDRGTPVYETVVTAKRDPGNQALDDNAASASVITSDRTPRSAESLPQLLSELPGVNITHFGALGSLAMISVRGSTPNQVQVYVDGVPLGSASAGAVDLGLIPVADAERIEIYRGMSPIAFGSSALGGIVVLRNLTPTSSGLGAEIGAASFGTRFGGLQGRWAGARIKALGSIHLLQSAGDFSYPSDNGTAFDPSDDSQRRRQNNSLNQVDGVLRTTLVLEGRRSVLASLSFLRREQGLPAPGPREAYHASAGTRRLIALAAYDAPDDLGPGGRLHAQTYAVLGEQAFRDELHEIAYLPTRTRDRSDTVGTTVNATWIRGTWLKARAVTDGRYESFRPFDELASEPSGAAGTRVFGAAGLEGDAWWQRWDLDVIPSLRLEIARDEIAGRDGRGNQAQAARPSNYVVPVPRLGLLERVGPVVLLRANVGRYARLPSMLERYGNTGRVVGNPGLTPERGVNADVGSTLTAATARTRLTVDAALFGAWVNDLIQFQKGAYQMRADNIGAARILGAELAFDGRAGQHARFILQGTFTDARDVSGISGSDGRQLSLRPRWRAYARPELRALRLGRAWQAGVYGDTDATGGNYLDPANLASLPARVLFGAGAYAESVATGVRVVVSAQNLGDSHVNDLADFPLPGRSIFLSLQFFPRPTTQNPVEEPSP